ncbi:MAG: hypothetical protein KAS86_02585, partial [Candidatus Omnitrophica bacterium]|nr:hypothetical protein [Candidatus Omnitrophota bacterium]
MKENETKRRRESLAAAKDMDPGQAVEVDQNLIDINKREIEQFEKKQGRFRMFGERRFIGRFFPDAGARIVELYAENARLAMEQFEEEPDKTEKEKRRQAAKKALEEVERVAGKNNKALPAEHSKLLAGIHAAKGDEATDRGDSNAALDNYDRAIELDAGNAKARLGMALALINKHADPSQIAGHLEKAIETDPALYKTGIVYQGTTGNIYETLLNIYEDMGDVAKSRHVKSQMEAKALKQEIDKVLEKIDTVEAGAEDLNAVISSRVSINRLQGRIKEDRAAFEEAIQALADPDKKRPYYVFASADLKLDEEELQRRKISLGSKMENFNKLVSDKKVFNQVIGNARGKPAGEAVEFFEAFHELLDDTRKSDRNITHPLYLALAEHYDKKGDLEKAAGFAEKITGDPFPTPDPAHRALMINAYILHAGLLLKTGARDRLGKAMGHFKKSAGLISGLDARYKDRRLAGHALSGFRELLKAVQSADVFELGKEEREAVKSDAFIVFQRLSALAQDTEAGRLVFEAALDKVDKEDIAFMEGILADTRLSDAMKTALLHAVLDRISRDMAVLKNLQGLRSAIESLLDPADAGLRARAAFVTGLLEGKGKKARDHIMEAIKSDRALESMDIVWIGLARTCGFNRIIDRWIYKRRARKIARQTAAEFVRQGNENMKKKKYGKAVKDYEQAVSMDASLKENAGIRDSLAKAHENDKGTRRERLNRFFRTREKKLQWEIDKLRRALETAADKDRKKDIRARLIADMDELAGLLIKRFERMSLGKRAREWNGFRASLSRLRASAGDLHASDMRYWLDKGQTYSAERSYDRAKQAFRQARRFDPENTQARDALDRLGREPLSEQDAEQLLKSAEDRSRQGEFEEALSLLDRAAEKDEKIKDKAEKTKTGIGDINTIVDALLDYFLRTGYLSEYAKWDGRTDPDGNKRERVQARFARELSGGSQKSKKALSR